MKKLLSVFVCFLLFFVFCSSVWADEKKNPFDVALSFNQTNFLWDGSGVEVGAGLSLGLTDRLEIRAYDSSTVIPKPFKKNLIAVELGYSLLGARNTGTRVAGAGFGSYITAGMFYKTHDNGWGILVGVDPITMGVPSTGRRERLCSTKIGWDFHNKKLIVAFSFIDFDLYLKGTYRDWK